MVSRYSVTTRGLAALAKSGVTVFEALQVVRSQNHVLRFVAPGVGVVAGQTSQDRYLLILIYESEFEDNDWDIEGGRDMTVDEIQQLETIRKMRRDQP